LIIRALPAGSRSFFVSFILRKENKKGVQQGREGATRGLQAKTLGGAPAFVEGETIVLSTLLIIEIAGAP
jgi:hypothetical protein